jgi:hypothetical protein
MNARACSLLVASVLLATALPARAEVPKTTPEPVPDTPVPPLPIDQARPGRPRDHVEFTMGFLGGQRAYDGLSFALDSGSPASTIPGATKLTRPFSAPPYTSVDMVGVRYEARVHISYVRMTAGFDLPFSIYNQAATASTYDFGGQTHAVAVQSLSAKEAHFGLGTEVPFGAFVPFVDLLGGVHWVNTDLAVDGIHGSYSATAFAFTLRGGARVYLRRWFFAQAAGEVGLVGDLRWNAELSVGAALPW